MNKSVFLVSAATALLLLPGQLSAVDLRATDPLPPTPPGNSLPPSASSTPAQSTPSATPSATPRKGQGKQAGERRFQKLKQELSLTPAQVAKIKPIIEKAVADAKALRANTSLPEAQKRKNMRQIFAASFQQIKPLLTPQQLQKWKQIRAERHNNQSTPSAANT
ncbi:hypothetical protein EV701_119100 [Chthoniobacter flavus]|uniref:Spy/CpxP family protein refolding chaperone n=1 Tax=Chthoniobacter flavus TaxID=191863 RepID=UPI00104E3F25|nr:hypothetical protein [Chthoniobacter flavus]TCO88056.1 hypothetical protein EV701_119100 [Chthoniobacter flavus]